jgi:serine/threonine-protein kinase
MSAPVQEGDILADKYCVEKVIGQGGMGVVVAARHIQLGQKVALKFLLPAACSDEGAVARFLREAQAAFQIQSEHVARILDVGTLANGAPFMVMEFLNGLDLSDAIRQGPLPVEEAVGYVLQACEAIAEAHSRGIVHRDLKPANLFLTHRPDGSSLVKVLDFGISKASGSTTGSTPSVTATAALMGSPSYMSPEQLRSSKHVDARTDVWALGVVIHQLVSGRMPFDGETMTELLSMIAADPPTRLRAVQPNAPAALEELILRCLEKDVARRTPNVAVLAQELAPFASPSDRLSVERVMRVLGQGGPGSVPMKAPDGVGGLRENTKSAWGGTRGDAPKRRPPRALVAAIVGTGVVVGVGTLLALRGPRVPGRSADDQHAATAAVQSVPAPGPSSAAPDRPKAETEVQGATSHAVSPDTPDAARSEPPVPPFAAPRAAPAPLRRTPAGVPPKGHPAAPVQPGGSTDMFDDTH